MKMISKTALFSIMALGAMMPAAARGQDSIIQGESRPVTGVYAIEVGRKKVLATYLSPLRYTGKDFTFSGAWSKAMPFNPQHALMHFNASTSFDSMLNPPQIARMVALSGSFSWGMSWRTRFPWQLQFTAGGAIGIDGGAYWLMRNGNNPIQAMASVNLVPRVSLGRPFKIGKIDFLVRDEVLLPSFSVFFSPEYGESYYEIYLGNHSGLIHAGWWGNNFRIDNLFSITFDFGRTAAMIGYRFKSDTQWANNLNTQIFTHNLVIGVIPGGIGLKPKARSLPAETIYSLY